MVIIGAQNAAAGGCGLKEAMIVSSVDSTFVDSRRGGFKAVMMLGLLSLAFVLSFFDRMLMIVLADPIRSEFGLSDKQLSLLTGASFVIVYGVCGIYAGTLADKFNRRKIFAYAVTLWSLTTALCGFAQSFIQLALSRAAVGASESALPPVGISMIGDLFSRAKRPMATAIFIAGGPVGVMLAFPFGAWLSEGFGWRMAFLCAGPLGLLLAGLIFLFGHEPAREKLPGQSSEQGAERRSLRLITDNKPLVWMVIAYSVATFSSVGMMQWLPQFFIRSHGISTHQLSVFFGPVLGGGLITGMLLGGWLGNRVAARSVSSMVKLCAWLTLLLIPLFLLVFLVPSMTVALALTFVTMAASVTFSPMAMAAWQTVCDPRVRGAVMGIVSFAGAIIGGAVCPFLVGAMSDLLAARYNADSLRYALIGGMVFVFAAGCLYYYSAGLTKRYFER